MRRLEEMPANNSDLTNKVNTSLNRIIVLETQISQFSSLLGKLDVTIDRLGDVSNYIKQLLAVHEAKIEQHEIIHDDLYNQLEKFREENKLQHQLYQTNINTLNTDINKSIQDSEKKSSADIKQLSDRTKIIENWRWLVLGIGAVIAFILTNLETVTRFLQSLQIS